MGPVSGWDRLVFSRGPAIAILPLVIIGACLQGSLEADPPAGPPELADAARAARGTLVRLSVNPASVEILGADRSAALVVSGVDGEGGVRDLTREASYTVSDPAVAAADPSGLVTPRGDGAAAVTVRAAGLEARVEVKVDRFVDDLPLSFPNDVVPIFSKHGCNSGGCHGKSGGQNGFALSLFGYVPAFDHASLARESRGRRVFPAAPEHSLLLLKATGSVPHGGGARLEAGSPDYRVLRRWMRSGLPFGKPDDPRVESIAVFPRHRVLERGARQALRVTARYTDGRVEDVTRRAEYSTGEEGFLEVDHGGLVRVLDLAGLGAVLVRYQGQVGLFRATIPNPRALSPLARPAPRGFIDRLLFARLDLLGIPSSPPAPDVEFHRRAALAICGTLPAAAEAEDFLRDGDPGKREKLIDRLLERPEHLSYFTLFWADLLRNQRGGDQKAAPHTIGFHRWLYESLAANRPFHHMVRELLCAEGSVADNPPVAWYRSLENPKELVDDVAQVFLGTRIQCARCHHHPFEKWGQEDYWHFAGFFSRLTRKNERTSRAFTVSLRRGSSRLTDDEPTSASFKKTYDGLRLPGAGAVEESADQDPRERLWAWMTSPEETLFARAVVNRYWKHFFGRGIVEPEDDLRETNPPSNPELLDALARDFAGSGYDLKRLVRTICTSAAYGLSSEPVAVRAEGAEGGGAEGSGEVDNRADRQGFSRFQPRRLPAEVLLDAVDQVTGVKTRFQGVPREARAIDLPDESARNYFLEVFGKPDRSSACACERSEDVTLPQVLHLLNSRELDGKLRSDEGRAAQLARDARPEADRVRELFLWVYSRPPEPEETEKALAHLRGALASSGGAVAASGGAAGERKGEAVVRRAWEDLLLALINTREFLFTR